MRRLVSELINAGYLKSQSIISAFLKIDRIDFVPEELKTKAYQNIALPIGNNQTISQPLTVAFMLELLEPQLGQKILDVGSGSGWTTALLAEIVGETGHVIATERIKDLVEFGKKNVEKYKFVGRGTVRIRLARAQIGFSAESPYDRILVSASAQGVPEELKAQLRIGGKMVIPVRSSIVYLERKGEDEYFEKEFPGFSFVPLIAN